MITISLSPLKGLLLFQWTRQARVPASIARKSIRPVSPDEQQEGTCGSICH